jgi:hypothetical protein
VPRVGQPRPPAGTHTCPCGCGKQIANRLFACRAGWYRLPKNIRSAIHTCHTTGDVAGHREAMADACTWYRGNPPTRRLGKL